MRYLVEFDSAGQEMRFMCALSGDPTLTTLFEEDKKVHAYMASQISQYPYDEIIDMKKADVEEVAGPHGLYNCGKYINLSNQYRVGAKKSRIIARVQYGLDVPLDTVKRWQKIYFKSYSKIKPYWGQAIRRAKDKGYAETLSGRRFYIHDWSSDARWGSESSAINFPIQGSGGCMKELAIAAIATQFQVLDFAWDLHDGLFYYYDTDGDPLPMVRRVRDMLDNLPYEKAWGWTPPIPMTWDAAITSTSWGEIEEI